MMNEKGLLIRLPNIRMNFEGSLAAAQRRKAYVAGVTKVETRTAMDDRKATNSSFKRAELMPPTAIFSY